MVWLPSRLKRYDKLPDLDSLSKQKFESKVESIYMEKLSDSIRNHKDNKDRKLQFFCEGFTKFCQSKYTYNNIPKHKLPFFTKFRFSSHNLVIETERQNKTLDFKKL